ncbi:MAG: hypothetical protein CMH90_05590 [Oceanicaulis sp.]|jgi:hypothetical protein|uniref:hypothetical protein n=1 Tax=Oceanicaulis sp. UBA2681 TaxID=1947007 RepID=UPI000C092201|nr:hypothetical protein [Oceanicaulis sp. UBA2681]MAP48936.1 hypothetical protein [Oceanicaulis sp.]MBL4539031.1 hypothetical protein [Oceanicaulis sp.]HCR65527.1 hypothetical protein [Oceanicaulis sp.]|tara:strand:- start:2179 stop:2763 length:585 start_codon:yes stop_codon:yes gene_type:complete
MRDQDKQHRLSGPDAPATAELIRIFARHGFTSSEEPLDVADASTVAVTALGGALASEDIVLACQARTQRCFFIRRNETGEASGFIALLFLNARGFEALMYGRLSPDQPELDLLTAPDERASAIYVWCLAGVSEADKRAVVRAVTEARRKAFPHVALFARPMSREGRMMTAALDAPSAGAAWLGWVPQAADASKT